MGSSTLSISRNFCRTFLKCFWSRLYRASNMRAKSKDVTTPVPLEFGNMRFFCSSIPSVSRLDALFPHTVTSFMLLPEGIKNVVSLTSLGSNFSTR